MATLEATGFANLVERLRGTRKAWVTNIKRFPEVDAAQLARDLDLDGQAAKAAGAGGDGGQPPFPDAFERTIRADLAKRARDARADYEAQLDLYETRIRDSKVGSDTSVWIKANGEAGLGNFKAQALEDRGRLVYAAESVSQIRRQHGEFVQRNRLHNVAPASGTPHETTISLIWIGVVVALETLANGFFFAKGSEAGLVGGIVEAFFLSVCNVSVSMLLGLVALRYARHVGIVRKLLGIIGSAVTFAIIVALNFLTAHYREAFAASGGASVDFRAVLASLTEAPLSLSSAQSWLLGAIGFGFAMFAAFKFFHLDDPYPGYGRISRRLARAREDVDAARAHALQTLTNHRDGAHSQMNDVITEISASRRDFELAIRSRDRLRVDFLAFLEALVDVGNQLLERYQRQAGRALHYFEQSEFGDAELPTVYTEGDHRHQEAVDSMSHYISRLSESYSEMVTEIAQRSNSLEE